MTDFPPTADAVPRLGVDGYTGILRDVVELYAGASEASPEALALQLLVVAGAAMGPSPWVDVDGTRQRTNLYVLIAGAPGHSRKSTAWGHVRDLVPAELMDGRAARAVAPRDTLTLLRRSPAVAPRQPLLVWDDYASGALALMTRSGTALGAVMTTAWDADAATVPLSWVGHTYPDAVRNLPRKNRQSPVLDRMLIAWVDRRELLPRPQPVDLEAADALKERLTDAIVAARSRSRVPVDPEAQHAWAWDASGPHGSPNLARVALILALLDQAAAVQVEHVRAARSMVMYSSACRRDLVAGAGLHG